MSNPVSLGCENDKLTGQDALDLFNQILMDDSAGNSADAEICMISGKPLNPKTSVELPCHHKFDYVSLFNDLVTTSSHNAAGQGLTCPYCTKYLNGVLPYRPDIAKLKSASINIPVSLCFQKIQCVKPECSTNATIPIGEDYYCYRHYRKSLRIANSLCPNASHGAIVTQCVAILKSGPRKGSECGAKAHSYGKCRRHLPSNQKP